MAITRGLEEPVVCAVCGKRHPRKIAASVEDGWSWFTGYLPATFHHCCQCSEHPTTLAMLKKSQIKPEGTK